MARTRVGMSIRYWICKVVVPICIVVLLVFAVGIIPQLFLPSSFLRMVLTTVFVLGAMVPSAWFVVLSRSERTVVRSQINRFVLRNK